MIEGELGKVYPNGEFIFKEGDQSDVLYIIQSGKVKITKNSTDGIITIATLEIGEIFGEMALFDQNTRSANAVSLGDAQVLSVDKKKLFKVATKDPTLLFKIIETLCQRLRTIDNEIMKVKQTRHKLFQSFLNVDDICDFILKELKEKISAENGSIMFLNEGEELLSIKSAYGSESNSKLGFHDGGIAGDVLKTGKAELINNVTVDNRFKKGDLHISSMMCVPLKLGDEVFGVINASNNCDKNFSMDDLQKICSISQWAAMAIQNARKFSKFLGATNEFIVNATVLSA